MGSEFYRRMGFEVTGRSDLDENGLPYPLFHMRLAGQAEHGPDHAAGLDRP